MEKTVQSSARRAQSFPARSSTQSRGTQALAPQAGSLAQLAAFTNDSPRVQGLMDLAGTINQSPPAQLLIDPRATLAHSDRSGAVDSIASQSGSQASEQSSCGCGAKQNTGTTGPSKEAPSGKAPARKMEATVQASDKRKKK
ncbi:MAG: hypothetical protein LAP21_11470 [Acidobacteriia bacterium]|nr:hypothetical protein [Terriglobia bacterium]